jgi:histidinol-phosphatase
VKDIGEARLVFASAKFARKHGKGAEFERLLTACGNDRGFCDAYGYALVATGRADIALDPVMSLWDTAALYPVVTEAGGSLTDWRGNATHTAPEAIATNGHLLEPVLRTIRG